MWPGHLAHSTLNRLLDTRATPRLPSPELLEAFLAGCDIPVRNRAAWHAAHERLVDSDERLSARAAARRERSAPEKYFVMPCNLAGEAQRHEDDYWFFRKLRKAH